MTDVPSPSSVRLHDVGKGACEDDWMIKDEVTRYEQCDCPNQFSESVRPLDHPPPPHVREGLCEMLDIAASMKGELSGNGLD